MMRFGFEPRHACHGGPRSSVFALHPARVLPPLVAVEPTRNGLRGGAGCRGLRGVRVLRTGRQLRPRNQHCREKHPTNRMPEQRMPSRRMPPESLIPEQERRVLCNRNSATSNAVENEDSLAKDADWSPPDAEGNVQFGSAARWTRSGMSHRSRSASDQFPERRTPRRNAEPLNAWVRADRQPNPNPSLGDASSRADSLCWSLSLLSTPSGPDYASMEIDCAGIRAGVRNLDSVANSCVPFYDEALPIFPRSDPEFRARCGFVVVLSAACAITRC